MNAISALPLPQVAGCSRSLRLPDAMDSPRQQMTSKSAGRLGYYQDVSKPGRPLVLIHSINAAPSAFEVRPLFDRLRRERPVYAPDLPGFGLSDRSDRPYSPELFARALEEFLSEIVRDQADVVACSLSAEFAARAALSAAELFNSLVLVSPTGFSSRSLPSSTLSRRIHKLLSLPLLSKGLFDLLTSRRSIGYFLNKSFVGEAPPEMIDYAYLTSHQPGAMHAPLYFLSGQLFTANAVEALYSKLRLPVLVLHDEDPNVSFDLLSGFAADHANCKVARIVPTLGLPHWEKAEETITAMEDFWSACDGP